MGTISSPWRTMMARTTLRLASRSGTSIRCEGDWVRGLQTHGNAVYLIVTSGGLWARSQSTRQTQDTPRAALSVRAPPLASDRGSSAPRDLRFRRPTVSRGAVVMRMTTDNIQGWNHCYGRFGPPTPTVPKLTESTYFSGCPAKVPTFMHFSMLEAPSRSLIAKFDPKGGGQS